MSVSFFWSYWPDLNRRPTFSPKNDCSPISCCIVTFPNHFSGAPFHESIGLDGSSRHVNTKKEAGLSPSHFLELLAGLEPATY